MSRWKHVLMAAALVAVPACDAIPLPEDVVYDGVSVSGTVTEPFTLRAIGGGDDPRPRGGHVSPSHGSHEEWATCVRLDGDIATLNTQTEWAPHDVTTWRVQNDPSGKVVVEGFELERPYARDCSPVPSDAAPQHEYHGGTVETWVDGEPVHNPVH